MSEITPIIWKKSHLELLDQRVLPQQEEWLALHDVDAVIAAIRDMVVRGAPAIGVTAAYGVVLAARAHAQAHGGAHADGWHDAIETDLQRLNAARPTAVNLHWAIERMRSRILGGATVEELEAEAELIQREDLEACRRMGDLGASMITQRTGIITHCNAGALATAGYGTALGVIRSAHRDGKVEMVYADETRPWLQGARLTAWELAHDDVPVTLIADSVASYLMRNKKIGWIVVGSDRIAANGDVANKIGTYQLAISARHHGVKFMVAAPVSTIDPDTPDGDSIPVEERAPEEVLSVLGQRVAADVPAWNPVFDVTPASLVDVIVTEYGVIESPDRDKIAAHLQTFAG